MQSMYIFLLDFLFFLYSTYFILDAELHLGGDIKAASNTVGIRTGTAAAWLLVVGEGSEQLLATFPELGSRKDAGDSIWISDQDSC